ncbi:uncharacterized protein LOC108034318 isoform X1 [Drosophila biarmipes]|uniref:uncharacterized protein LOC108034318 isoform X1 n=1 Tax=Drosophila biarmipes TaxID=125945 RepID=UPI0021CCB279|nr:uncharacterized protein LOC108034318 isoform X1 [Drosophila biarmipes]
MEDWEDTSTAEMEAVAMMRSFGMKSMSQDLLPVLPQISVQGQNRLLPLNKDPEFCSPCKMRRPKDPPPADNSKDSADDSLHTAESMSNCILVYGSGNSSKGETQEKNNKELKEGKAVPSFSYIKAIPVHMDKGKGRRKSQRSSQK